MIVQKRKASDSSLIGDYLGNFKTENGLSKEENTSAQTTNDQDAFNVYTFAAKNSDVEWGMAGISDNNRITFKLYTNHDDDGTNISHLDFTKTIFSIHSHKNNNYPSPSRGQDGDYRVEAANRYYTNGYRMKSYLLYAPNEGSMHLWYYRGSYDQKFKVKAIRGSRGTVSQGELNMKKLDINR